MYILYFRYQPESNFDDDNYVSETELNQISGISTQRSATIGADTPPTTAQQTGYSSSSSTEPCRVGAVGIDSECRETDLDGANTLDESLPSASSIPPETNRRDNIDGGQAEDSQQSSGSQDKGRKSRNYDSDEQKERHRNSSPGRYEDRRYYDDRRRESPDRYKKYDRRDRHRGEKRYEDDADYYSDKERNDRRMREERDDYGRYNSLRRDKDREKRRRDYDRDDRRNDYYYRYDEDYYRDSNRSRPSSRSDSMHDSYRERSHRERHELDRSMRHKDRDRDRDQRRREHYNQYYPVNILISLHENLLFLII